MLLRVARPAGAAAAAAAGGAGARASHAVSAVEVSASAVSVLAGRSASGTAAAATAASAAAAPLMPASSSARPAAASAAAAAVVVREATVAAGESAGRLQAVPWMMRRGFAAGASNLDKKGEKEEEEKKAEEAGAVAKSAEDVVAEVAEVAQEGEVESEENALAAFAAGRVLGHDAIAVTRKLELGTLLVGFEQANKYELHNQAGEVIGYLAEEGGVGKTVGRQLLRTRRKFEATLFDKDGNIVLKIVRPVFLMSSSMYITTAQDEPIGEVHMRWKATRRAYDLFVHKEQFASIDQMALSWDFIFRDADGLVRGGVNKNWRGFGRELFTDAGQYVVRFTGDGEGLYSPTEPDASQVQPTQPAVINTAGAPLNMLERAVALACAITVDNDYFSQHSHIGGGWLPWVTPIPSSTPPDAPTEGGAPDDSGTMSSSEGASDGEEAVDWAEESVPGDSSSFGDSSSSSQGTAVNEAWDEDAPEGSSSTDDAFGSSDSDPFATTSAEEGGFDLGGSADDNSAFTDAAPDLGLDDAAADMAEGWSFDAAEAAGEAADAGSSILGSAFSVVSSIFFED